MTQYHDTETFVMSTKINERDPVGARTAVTVVWDGMTEIQKREMVKRQLRVDLAQPWRAKKNVPDSVTVVMTEHCNGRRGQVSAADIDRATTERAKNDAAYRAAKIAELLAMDAAAKKSTEPTEPVEPTEEKSGE